MNKDWVIIFSSSQSYEVEMIKGLLLENEIESMIVNKQDSLYLFGEIELHIHIEDIMKAKLIISDINENQ